VERGLVEEHVVGLETGDFGGSAHGKPFGGSIECPIESIPRHPESMFGGPTGCALDHPSSPMRCARMGTRRANLGISLPALARPALCQIRDEKQEKTCKNFGRV
jgi:hypothetical protein